MRAGQSSGRSPGENPVTWHFLGDGGFALQACLPIDADARPAIVLVRLDRCGRREVKRYGKARDQGAAQPSISGS